MIKIPFWRALLVAMAVATASADAATVDLVKDGRARCSIVIPSTAAATEKLAASQLADYVHKITGAQLRIEADPMPGLIPVRIGLVGADAIETRPALADLTRRLRADGFIIDARPDGIQIVADNRHATLFGVFYVIRKYGAVYWFTPDDEEDVPHSPDFSIPAQLTLKNPAAMPFFEANGVWTPPHRMLFLAKLGARGGDPPPPDAVKPNMREQFDCALELGLYEDPVKAGTYFTPLLVPGWDMEKRLALFNAHPEYFGLRGGKRVLTEGELRNQQTEISQPCTSSPEVIQRLLREITARIDAARGATGGKVHFTFINDDHYRWCECARCRQLDDPEAAPEGAVSDRWWTYVNNVARSLLDRYGDNIAMTVFAYQNFRDPPRRTRPLSNARLTVKVCPHGRCYLHALTNDACPHNAKYRRMYEEWRARGVPVASFEYFSTMPGPSCYIPVERTWIADLQYLVSHSPDLTLPILMDIKSGDIPYLDHPFWKQYKVQNIWQSLWQLCWLTAHFAWDPDDDFETVWDEVNARYYGRAWEHIRPYRLLLEKALRDSGAHALYSNNTAPLGRAYDMPGFAQQAEKLLAEAMAAVAEDPPRLRRVVKEKEYFTRTYKESGLAHFGGTPLRVERAQSGIELDGRLDEADWIKADSIDSFFGPRLELTVGRFTNEPAIPQTKAKVLYDNANVYFGIECMKSGGTVHDAPAPDGQFPWQSSHLELFLVTQSMAASGQYYQIAFTRDGHEYSALTDAVQGADPARRLDFDYRITDQPDRWWAEIRVPVVQLGVLTNGTVWKFNIGRAARQADGRIQNTSLSFGGFHSLATYRLLSFGAPGPLLLNGGFEDLGEPPIQTDGAQGAWIFRSEKTPLHWTYLPNSPGTVEARTDGAADGRAYLRLERGAAAYPILTQLIHTHGNPIDRFELSLQMRGQGALRVSLYSNRTWSYLDATTFKVASADWQLFTHTLQSAAAGPKALFLQLESGCLDLDDVRLTVDGIQSHL